MITSKSPVTLKIMSGNSLGYPCLLEVVGLNDNVVILEDMGSEEYRSITNAAEKVVREINDRWPGRKIYYYDTNAEFWQLVHKTGDFRGFCQASIYEDPNVTGKWS